MKNWSMWTVAVVAMVVMQACGGGGTTEPTGPPETCEEDTDCGDGWVCRATSDGEGRCVDEAEAGEEVCGNDIDDDGNDAIDCQDMACAEKPACDADGDGVLDAADNCPAVENAEQADADGDGVGDACDDDVDGDEVPDGEDNCPETENADQADADEDGDGDVCDDDDDGDGTADGMDCAPTDGEVYPGAEEMCDSVDSDCDDSLVDEFDDLDGDGTPDCVDEDDDDDGKADAEDNCPMTANEEQGDVDGDGDGDACDATIPVTVSDTKFTGESGGDFAGQSVASAGDVNGDGKGDMLIGADTVDGAMTTDNGAAYLVLGGKGPGMQTSLSNADTTFLGASEGDRAGVSVAGAGDVNGDGKADLLIGAWLHDGSGSDSGVAYLVYGGDSLGSTVKLDENQRGATFIGEAKDDSAGFSVAGAGDVNGDGKNDILIGAPFNDTAGKDAGAAYLFFGGGDLSGELKLKDADVKFNGANPGEKSGRVVAGLGDINGDGLADIAVGAPDFGGVPARSGAVYVVLGSKSLGGEVSLASADAKVTGTKEGQQLGTAIAAGDFDGDGTPDLAAGAPQSGEGGAVFGFSGATLSGDLTVDGADFSLAGEMSDDRAGFSVAAVPDLTGDGADELLVGAPRSDINGIDSGLVYLVMGASGFPTATTLADANYLFIGAEADQIVGEAVAAVADLSGDGLPELLLSARGDAAGGSKAGAVFLYHSPIP